MYHRHASLYNVETMQQTISFTMPFLAFMVVGHIGLPMSHKKTLTGSDLITVYPSKVRDIKITCPLDSLQSEFEKEHIVRQVNLSSARRKINNSFFRARFFESWLNLTQCLRC